MKKDYTRIEAVRTGYRNYAPGVLGVKGTIAETF